MREQRVLPPLDRWLATLFDSEHTRDTVHTLITSSEVANPALTAKAEVARKQLADADRKLAQYRKALDAGADPALVAGWIAEVRADRAEAERHVADDSPTPSTTETEIRATAAWLAESAERFNEMMERANPALRQQFYDELGLVVLYSPARTPSK